MNGGVVEALGDCVNLGGRDRHTEALLLLPAAEAPKPLMPCIRVGGIRVGVHQVVMHVIHMR